MVGQSEGDVDDVGIVDDVDDVDDVCPVGVSPTLTVV